MLNDGAHHSIPTPGGKRSYGRGVSKRVEAWEDSKLVLSHEHTPKKVQGVVTSGYTRAEWPAPGNKREKEA